jgi:hypothetical protein
MVKVKKNTVKTSGIVALFCLSLACFTYINSVSFPGDKNLPDQIYVEEMAPESPEVLPDVELINRLVRKAFEFMSRTSF